MVPDTASRLPLIETKRGTGVCAADLQSSNHTPATRKKTKLPFKSNTTAAILVAHWHVIIPGSVRSLQKFSTVCKEKNTSVLKLIWGFCFKEEQKWEKREEMVSSDINEITGRCDWDIHWYLTPNSFYKKVPHAAFYHQYITWWKHLVHITSSHSTFTAGLSPNSHYISHKPLCCHYLWKINMFELTETDEKIWLIGRQRD